MMAGKAYDALASTYDDGYAGPRWALYDEVTLAVAATFLPVAPARVLDAGAGSGKFALSFLARGDHVTLLDPSAKMLEAARAKVEARGWGERAAYAHGGIEAMDFPDGAFDFVFCEGDPLSYCRDARAPAARELMRVLRPGGGFYVSVDNGAIAAMSRFFGGRVEEAFAAAEQGVATDPYGVPVHAFGPQELHDLLAEAGAADLRVSGKIAYAHLLPEAALAPVLADPDARRRLTALEIAAARDPRMAGLSSHLHAVGRKP